MTPIRCAVVSSTSARVGIPSSRSSASGRLRSGRGGSQSVEREIVEHDEPTVARSLTSNST